MLLWRAQLRFLLRTPWSLAVALLGLSLGIASVVAVHLLTEELVRTLDRGIPAHLQQASHTLTGAELTTTQYFALREAWRDGELPTVTALAPLVQGTALLAGQRYEVVGLDWLALLEPGLAQQPGLSAAPGTTGGASFPFLNRVYLGGSATVAVGEQLDTRAGQLTVAGAWMAAHQRQEQRFFMRTMERRYGCSRDRRRRLIGSCCSGVIRWRCCGAGSIGSCPGSRQACHRLLPQRCLRVSGTV